MTKVSNTTRSLSLLFAIGVAGCNTTPTPGVAYGESLYGTCAPCHGDAGHGNQDLAAPAIAGMDQWYVEAQLTKFQKGQRGYHHEDQPGLRMRPMAYSLNHEGDIPSVAEYVSQLPKAEIEATVQGSVASGQESYKICASCHGVRGEGNEALKAPSLNDKSDWYLATQLHNFKHGLRGTHPEDTTGAQMVGMAATLADQDAINGVVAYMTALTDGRITSMPAAAGDPGAAAYGSCTACHGTNGEGNAAVNAPRIAGMPAWYVEGQLNKFRAGHRGAHPDDIYGSQMAPMAAGLADEAAVKAVSTYVEGLEAPAAAATLSGDAAAGEKNYTVCIACHMTDGAGNEALNSPPLTGQADWYLVRQLNNFKSGVRGKHPEDTTGAQMAPMSMTLADEAAVNNVVAYIGTLKPAAPGEE